MDSTEENDTNFPFCDHARPRPRPRHRPPNKPPPIPPRKRRPEVPGFIDNFRPGSTDCTTTNQPIFQLLEHSTLSTQELVNTYGTNTDRFNKESIKYGNNVTSYDNSTNSIKHQEGHTVQNIHQTPLFHPFASFRRAPHSEQFHTEHRKKRLNSSPAFSTLPSDNIDFTAHNGENSNRGISDIPDIIYGEDINPRHIEVVNPYATHRRTGRKYPKLNLERTNFAGTTITQFTNISDAVSDNNNTIELFLDRHPADESIINYVHDDVRNTQNCVTYPNATQDDGITTSPDQNNPHHDKIVKRWRVKGKNENKRLPEARPMQSDNIEESSRGPPTTTAVTEGPHDDEDVESSSTFFYCRWITRYPVASFAATFVFQVLIVMATVMLLLVNYDLFPTEFELLPMSDLSVPWLKRDLAWDHRDEFEPEVGARYVRKWYLQGVDKWFRSMAYGRANIILYYDTGDGNIFNKRNLLRIQEIENTITEIPEYQDFCVQTRKLHCEKPLSILRFFDGTLAILDPVFKDSNFDNIPGVLHAAHTNNYTKAEFAFFLSKGSEVGSTKFEAVLTRSIIPIGFPLLPGQKIESMEEEMKEFLMKNFKPVIEKLRRETSQFSLVYWSYILFRNDIVKQIAVDGMFALGSVLFILMFIIYHTKSLWISMLGVFSILTSFLCANMVYRIMLDFRYFGFFHVIALFIILGIGADDLFVFIDVWKATGYNKYPSLAHRLSDTYKKSILSMFFTSLTTTCAFFASAVSPLLAPMSFGVFAGVLVIINFISVITYFPTVVVIHHLYFQHRHWPCLNWLKFNKTDTQLQNGEQTGATWPKEIFEDNTAVGTAGNAYNVIGRDNPAYTSEVGMYDEYGFIKRNNERGSNSEDSTNRRTFVLPTGTDEISPATVVNSNDNKDAHETFDPKPKQRKILVRFFRDYYFRFITHWAVRWIIVVTLMAVVVFFSFCASKIETENEQARFYRSSHNYGRALELEFHGFVASKRDLNVAVYIVWGLQERDMSGCHFSDPRCVGTQRYDKAFNPNSPEAQLALKRFCDRLYNFTAEELDRFKISRDVVTHQPEIKCFTKPLTEFLQIESLRTGVNMSLPWNYTKTIDVMQSMADIYSTNRMDDSFNNQFEIPISYWLNNGYRFENKNDFNTYQSLIGESISRYSTPVKTDMSVFYGNRLVYLGMQVNLTLGRYTAGYPEGKPALDAWETFVKEEMHKMPPGLRNGFQATKSFWHSVSIQKTMADNAIYGVVIGIILAFPILTVATQNVVIGFFATLCMCCSTVCVIGIIPLAGWKLGIIESLNMCMVVGLSVDYVVHLAEGYHMSTNTDRKSRVQDMLEIMGISVFSGACTTLGASVFMFFAQISFIIRFGMFMFCTIGFSLVFSLGLFATLMGILGPSGTTGDIGKMFEYLRSKCKCRSRV